MLSRINLRAGLIVLALSFVSEPATAQEVVTDPERVRLEVEDLRRLANVLRALATESPKDTAAMIDREYLANASAGLRAYAARYSVTGSSIAAALAAEPSRYANLNALADALVAQGPALRVAFRKLQEFHPDAVFPPIWFVVGDNGPGGLARPEGVLIAAERFTGHPEDVVPLVLHELTHIQQATIQGLETYRRIYGPDQTLLALALREGTAELIAVLTTGRLINPVGERYGLAHERELWAKFREEMYRRETGDWMFVRPSNHEWPPDLGYWVGYRIAKSFFEAATDKRRAVRDMLALTDFVTFVAASQYAGGVR